MSINKRINIFFLLLCITISNIKAYQYKVPLQLLYSVAKTESYNIFYPYIISINSKRDIEKLKKVGIKLKNNRYFDCYDLKTCINSVKLLVRAGINNIDLGVFQINYKYHKLPIKDYFILKNSAIYVDNLIYKLSKEFNKWNWKILAMYHSATPYLNKQYIKNVNYFYNKLLLGNKKLKQEFLRFKEKIK